MKNKRIVILINLILVLFCTNLNALEKEINASLVFTKEICQVEDYYKYDINQFTQRFQLKTNILLGYSSHEISKETKLEEIYNVLNDSLNRNSFTQILFQNLTNNLHLNLDSKFYTIKNKYGFIFIFADDKDTCRFIERVEKIREIK